jgi:tRNA dimethylallyltransferase
LSQNKKQIYLLGPTASGKTELAKYCMDHFSLEIISVDSAQIYNYFDIGSAKPDKNELHCYPHRLINIINPDQSYSVAKFLIDCQQHIGEIYQNGKSPFLVGGTMMYFNALSKPINATPASTKESRDYFNGLLANEGLPSLFERLKKVDPEYAKKINQADTQRILRALEVNYLSNKTLSSFHTQPQKVAESDHILKLALLPTDRKLLHERIELRVDQMLAQGFIEEVRTILKLFKNIDDSHPAMRCVGYKQIYLYLNNQISKETLREKIIFATRQLAKRQITWLRQMDKLEVVDPFDEQLTSKVHDKISQFMDS